MPVPVLTDEALALAVATLRAGQLVAFPTETVYGLGADASNPEALARLYALKGRPTSHPVIVHVAQMADVTHWARTIPSAAQRLADAFWPGPLTMIFPRAPHVLDAVTGGQDTVGIRIPRHPVALALLSAFGGGVAAPSANRFGRISPTRSEHVRADLGDAVPVLLEGGPCEVGVESTIVDFTGEQPRILRPGMILPADLARVLDIPGDDIPQGATEIRVSGSLPSHYAPRTPACLVASEALSATLAGYPTTSRVAVLTRQSLKNLPPHVQVFPAPASPEAYARQLYQALREMDGLGCDIILIETVPSDPGWLALHDRLNRAAAPR